MDKKGRKRKGAIFFEVKQFFTNSEFKKNLNKFREKPVSIVHSSRLS